MPWVTGTGCGGRPGLALGRSRGAWPQGRWRGGAKKGAVVVCFAAAHALLVAVVVAALASQSRSRIRRLGSEGAAVLRHYPLLDYPGGAAVAPASGAHSMPLGTRRLGQAWENGGAWG